MNWINELRWEISNFPWNKDIFRLMQEWNKDKALEILKTNDELNEKFTEIFSKFYIENKQMLDEHAKKFWEIFWFKLWDELRHQKFIFALYLNNSVQDFSKNMWIIGCSFDFVQLVTEYINWDNFLETFPEFWEIQNISCVDIRWEEWQKIIDKLFTAMKEKYSLSPR